MRKVSFPEDARVFITNHSIDTLIFVLREKGSQSLWVIYMTYIQIFMHKSVCWCALGERHIKGRVNISLPCVCFVRAVRVCLVAAGCGFFTSTAHSASTTSKAESMSIKEGRAAGSRAQHRASIEATLWQKKSEER